jgi:membrane fusion protein, multidrug efflux system
MHWRGPAKALETDRVEAGVVPIRPASRIDDAPKPEKPASSPIVGGQRSAQGPAPARSRLHNGILLLALAVALVSAAWWWRIPTVTTVLPVRGTAAEVVYATGVVEPRTWAKVTALVRKRIVEMCDCEGKVVQKGSVLARLDDVEERAVLSELQARNDRLKEDVARYKGLLDRNVTTRVAYEDKLTQQREYDARVAAQKDRLLDLELRAPMDGVVLRRDGEVGEVTGTGPNDVLFWVGQPKPLRLTAEVNEEDIAKVKIGQTVLLRHDGVTSGPLKATVGEITPKGDPATKTFRVYFALPDDTPLKIGMSVEANIIVREVKDALLVPVESVNTESVWIVDAGRLRPWPVVTGIKSARLIEIVSGLDEEQSIVAPATPALKAGARARSIRATTK